MSGVDDGTGTSGTGDHDLLAAEYDLGSLEAAELLEAERLLRDEPGFARSVEAWQRRLAPLAALVDPAEPPPSLWDRIQVSTAAPVTTVVPLRRVRFWQAATAGSLALAASLAAFLIVRQPDPRIAAVLTPADGRVPVLVATAGPGDALRIVPQGTLSVPSDRDMELWALAKGETRPRSLGVLPAEGRQLVASLAPDTELMVSLEPRGGSPSGLPTGPVLYAGTVNRLN